MTRARTSGGTRGRLAPLRLTFMGGLAPPLALRLAFMGGLALCPPPSAAVAATLRAVVIGVNAYQHETPLAGSVNDADSVAAAIAPLAAGVVRLTDAQVTREAVVAALDTALRQSARGDTLLVSYSGHGGRERVRVTPETPTGYREFWVMAGFDRKTPEGQTHRVLSTEIGAWLERARAAGVRVVLLADHCYAGKIYRSLGVDTGNIRSIPTMIASGVPANEPPPKISELKAAPPPPGLVSLAADTSDKPVAEFRVSADNKVHGALSFAFANALTKARRDIDPGDTGHVTVGGLQAWLGRAVNLMSDGQQYAQLRSGDPEDTVLFSWASSPAAKPPGAPASLLPSQMASSQMAAPQGASPPPLPGDGLPVLALHVSGVPETEGQALAAAIPGAAWTPDAPHARLVWERRGGAAPLVTGMNLFVSFDLTREELPVAVQAARVTDALTERAAKGRLALAVEQTEGPPMPVHFSGDVVSVTARALPGPNLVVFNLTGKGVVQMLYPGPRDAPIAWPPANTSAGITVLRARVEPDYGGDHVIAIAGPRSLRAVAAALSGLDGRADPRGAYRAVLAALSADPQAELSVAALYTADRARACDPEIIRDATMAARCPIQASATGAPRK